MKLGLKTRQMGNLKIGDTFRVFKITEDLHNDGIYGKFFAECNDEYKDNIYGVNIPYVPSWDTTPYHIGIDERKQGKLVAKLKITKVN